MRETACLVINPIIVDGYASLFNCTTVVRASNDGYASLFNCKTVVRASDSMAASS